MIQLYTSFDDVPVSDWEHVAANKTVYLQTAYLNALEEAMNGDMEFYYAIAYNEKKEAQLVSSFQLVTFIDKRKKYTDHLCKLSYHLHKKISDTMNINVLVCGNVFCDGENGLAWTDDLNDADAMDLAGEIVDQLKSDLEVEKKSSLTLFKEFWPESVKFSDRLKQWNYRDFMIDVNMVLDIHPSWNSFDDYLKSMKTKFRTRAKGVMKKSSELQLRSLSSDEIREHKEKVNELFSNVLEKSDFSFGKLKASAFANIKDALGDLFEFKGFFLGDELEGFSTSFKNGDSLEANFVGINYKLNNELAIYQRILYDYVEQSLKCRMKDLQLGRTAELMKSQIGALPTNMKLYVKHQKSVPNLLLKPILHSISPSEFEIRQPFKANFSN